MVKSVIPTSVAVERVVFVAVVSTVKSFVATVAGSVVASMSSSVEVAAVKSEEDGLYLEGIVKTEDLHCFEGFLV